MARNRTNASGYRSRFGGGWVSAPQWLAESMCDRMARKDGKTLPLKFWEGDWKRAFLLQLRHANGLLKVYSLEAILAALKSPQGKKIYSLGAKWLDDLVRKEEKAIVLRPKRATLPRPQETVLEKPRPTFVSKPSLLDKLKGL